MRAMWFRALAIILSAITVINIITFDSNSFLADTVPAGTAEDFVERGYSLMLGRESDEAGLEFWTNDLYQKNIDAAGMITLFVESEEFKSKALSNADAVEIFYEVMLGRASDEEGKAYWVDVLDTGFSYRHIVNGFANSPEFNEICESYGIVAGNINFVESRDMNRGTTTFVAGCYKNILSRTPDADGLNYWTSLINDRTIYPEELIHEFFYTEEGQSKIKNDSDYIDALYKSFLGREADAEGKDFWLNSIKDGVTREDLYDNFKHSDEFDKILSSHDLSLRPTPTPTPTPIPGKMVALTFDDGPYSPVTNRILDQLEAVGGHATFFVVGDRVNTYSSCVIRANDLGCEIANHTYDHKHNLASVAGTTIRAEVSGCNNVVEDLIGIRPKIMRPCGGSFSDTTRANVGMPMIIWSLDTQDWKNRDTQKTANAILNNVSDGDIILMHDLYPSTAAAMEIVIPELTRRGYTLVTVSELAEAKGIDLQDGEAYYSLRG
ncbi:MAG: DUF4214 domain-containing protein [Clostridiales bacterium]|nr:DUF4214 domain-containing protein [Clostridiales bacterium]